MAKQLQPEPERSQDDGTKKEAEVQPQKGQKPDEYAPAEPQKGQLHWHKALTQGVLSLPPGDLQRIARLRKQIEAKNAEIISIIEAASQEHMDI